MKQISIILLCGAGGVGAFFLGRVYYPKDVLALPKIAVVDGLRLKNEATPFAEVVRIIQRDTEQIEKNMDTKFAKKREELKKTTKLLSDKTIPPKKRAEYKAQYEQESAKIKEELQKQTDVLRNKVKMLEQMLNDAMVEITKDLAKKYNLNIVLNTSVANIMTVYYADKSLDLTDEAVDMLNKRLQKLE
ncbi:MAG: OmpH family outer membrane protein [Holosporales bacterium]|jgi:Skp family chaperone for outer membrane proteins|nr:OmpH family outer membrane protein [Holosporales bacterium]